MKVRLKSMSAMGLLSILLLIGCDGSLGQEGLNNLGRSNDDMGASDDMGDMADMPEDMMEEPVDLGPPDMGPPDLGPPDMGPPDMDPEDMPPDMCVPRTAEEICQSAGANCGQLFNIPDGCGGEVDVESCGICTVSSEVCGGDPMFQNRCGCERLTCAQEGILAGEFNDNCGITTCDLFEVASLSIGAFHGCAVGRRRIGAGNDALSFSDNQVACWGRNASGQLGLGTTGLKRNLSDVLGLRGTQTLLLSSGAQHTCAVLANGKGICWGRNDVAQLGTGTTVSNRAHDLTVPNNFVLQSGVKQIVSGDRHTCALVDTDTSNPLSEGFQVLCWGSNEFNLIGRQDIMPNASVSTPRVPNGLSDGVIQLAAGASHTCALKADGTVWCWGLNNFNQSGNRLVENISRTVSVNGSTSVVETGPMIDNYNTENIEPFVPLPTAIRDEVRTTTALSNNLLRDVKSIAAGERHTCAIKTDGTVWCWGSMPYQHAANTCQRPDWSGNPQLCNSWPPTSEGVPVVRQSRDTGMNRLWAPVQNALAEPRGTYYNRAVAPSPTQVNYSGGSALIAEKLSTYFHHTCAVIDEPDPMKTNVVCFGRNNAGQLGDGTTSAQTYPLPIIRDDDGEVVRVLLPQEPAPGDPNADDIRLLNLLSQPISVGVESTCALIEDKTIKCWGSNRDGQLGNEDLVNDKSLRPFNAKLD